MEPRAGLLLANRAYLDHDQPPGGPARPEPGHGGLLAAVRPVIAPWEDGSGTVWIGPGRGPHDRDYIDAAGYELIDTPRGPLRQRRLFFDAADWQGHYREVSNGFLWPLLHLTGADLPHQAISYPAPVLPSGSAWAAFERTNLAFAQAALGERPAASCWVHDYQLALVPGILRQRGFAQPIGFFLHTPFPDVDVALAGLGDPARERFASVLRGILGADLVGLQTPSDQRRLQQGAVSLLGARAGEGWVELEGRRTCTGAYAVGIDADELLAVAQDAVRPPQISGLGSERPLVVGLERADYTKGIPERLRAIARAYHLGARFDYAGFAAPTREGVRGYAEVLQAIDHEAAAAETAAYAAGCRFLQSSDDIPWEQAVALQAAADVVFTSSLSDGMNLVPLQAAVLQSLRPPAERAVILAGRGAGVAEVYRGQPGLVAVDPFDIEGMARALVAALEGRPARVGDAFIAAVRQNDARRWATRYLSDLGDCP